MPNHRQMTTEPPAAVSGEPTIELPLEPSENGSEATASGLPAVIEPLPDTDRVWIEGKPGLIEMGVTERTAGKMIGLWLRDGHAPLCVLDAITAARQRGTQDPVAFIAAVLRRQGAAPRQGRRAGMTAILLADYGATIQ